MARERERSSLLCWNICTTAKTTELRRATAGFVAGVRDCSIGRLDRAALGCCARRRSHTDHGSWHQRRAARIDERSEGLGAWKGLPARHRDAPDVLGISKRSSDSYFNFECAVANDSADALRDDYIFATRW